MKLLCLIVILCVTFDFSFCTQVLSEKSLAVEENTTTAAPTKAHNSTTTPNATAPCSASDCQSCVGSSFSCVWCAGESSSPGYCSTGSWWGTSTDGCTWQWKQCLIDGRVALFVSLGVFALIVCCCGLLCICCLCNPCKHRKDYKHKYGSFSAINEDADEKKGLLDTPQTNAERQRLTTKYNLSVRDKASET